MQRSQTDVFIVGGGPAGLAAAIAARQEGFSVAFADCARPPIDKACGEGIMPDGLAALSRLGIDLTPDVGCAFSGIRFVSGNRKVEAVFPQGEGIGVRRTVLHEMLIAKARELGVESRWGAVVSASADGSLTVNGDPIQSRWIIGADGLGSQTRKWAGLDHGRTRRRRFGFRRHYAMKPHSEFVEIHWSDRAQMYITPIASDRVCVALISGDQHLRFSDGLRLFPELEARFANEQPVSSERGALSLTRKLHSVYSGNVALIGEASGSVDAITGDGLSLAFQQAVALARAMRTGDLAQYQRQHERITRLPRFMGEVMLAMDGRPRFRERVFAALTADATLFERMLAIHTGAARRSQFGVRNAFSLGWNFIMAPGAVTN